MIKQMIRFNFDIQHIRIQITVIVEGKATPLASFSYDL